MQHINASGFFSISSNPACVAYSANKNDLVPWKTFEQALQLKLWRELSSPFAQFILNTTTNEFILVRDHIGLRPLYYWHQPGKFIFGDNLADIIQQLPESPDFDSEQLEHMLASSPQYSDKTIYHDIHRVEPGHLMHYNPTQGLVKKSFWQLLPSGDELYYSDERDYLHHFDGLMQESVQQAIAQSPSVAAEFSAGIDSSAIYCVCKQLGVEPTLFMHAASPGSASEQSYNDYPERVFVENFPSAHIKRILEHDFDPIEVFKTQASWFAGPSYYIFDLFAHALHQAVVNNGHTLLLSGFGGDQGVSHPVPTRFILPSLIKANQFRQAWRESQFSSPSTIGRLLLLLQSAHPKLNAWSQVMRSLKTKNLSPHPHYSQHFESLRQAQWSFLQGPNSNEVRMRIEYSSIVAKKMGFEYRYPLLYPKLLEFFLSLPWSQKRYHGLGRYLIRRYLASQIPNNPFEGYKKKEGLNIICATFDAYKTKWEAGDYQQLFQALPYKEQIGEGFSGEVLIKTIQAFMLKTRCCLPP